FTQLYQAFTSGQASTESFAQLEQSYLDIQQKIDSGTLNVNDAEATFLTELGGFIEDIKVRKAEFESQVETYNNSLEQTKSAADQMAATIGAIRANENLSPNEEAL